MYGFFLAEDGRKFQKLLKISAKPGLEAPGIVPMNPASRAQASGLGGGAIVEDLDGFEGGEAALEHLVEDGEEGVDFFGAIDDLDDDGEVHGEAEDF